ncbi:hypothetical protein DHEL01_v206853 [Diaporthe helianthi]|uniref:Uncharacterized protein n=1 Tax=Diaporthe helianthi TaxID=158607 RepID=A0A2P5HWY0_DIAHE|nr:hypothetical protein DHEL01_v206853 [Diaporthe helianthi]
MRDNLDRLSETVLILTRQNKSLQEGHCFKEDSVSNSEKDEFLSTADPEEDLLRAASRIQRKKASTDLRSEIGERVATDSESLDQPLVKNQGQHKDEAAAEIPGLKSEISALQAKLDSAQHHILHHSGNLGALVICEDVKSEFKSIVSAIQTWITTCVVPAFSNPKQCFQAFQCTRKIRGQDARLNLSRARNQDFRATSKFRGADDNVILVMIFDLLVEMVFSAEVIYGDNQLQREIDVTKQLGDAMRLNSGSSKSLYNSRRWMSEAVTAILSRNETQARRADFCRELAGSIIRGIGLPALLGHSSQIALEDAESFLLQEVVVPAVDLGDKMAYAIDKYSLGVPSYWTEPCMFQAEFLRDLPNLDCKNFGQGSPRFKLEQMRRTFSEDEIRCHLRAICPAIPALLLTEASDKEWGPCTILVKQQVWVSWQPKEESPQQPREKGYFWFLYHKDQMSAGVGKE